MRQSVLSDKLKFFEEELFAASVGCSSLRSLGSVCSAFANLAIFNFVQSNCRGTVVVFSGAPVYPNSVLYSYVLCLATLMISAVRLATANVICLRGLSAPSADKGNKVASDYILRAHEYYP
jgi:hypothetical protein